MYFAGSGATPCRARSGDQACRSDRTGLRGELAELVAARGLGLLDAWLGPVETKLEILAVLAAGRNLLLEGPVGSGKTLLGESIAAALPPIRLAGCHFNCLPGEAACPQCRAGLVASGELELSGPERFVRVQGSPDLFPEDLVGDVDPPPRWPTALSTPGPSGPAGWCGPIGSCASSTRSTGSRNGSRTCSSSCWPSGP